MAAWDGLLYGRRAEMAEVADGAGAELPGLDAADLTGYEPLTDADGLRWREGGWVRGRVRTREGENEYVKSRDISVVAVARLTIRPLVSAMTRA